MSSLIPIPLYRENPLCSKVNSADRSHLLGKNCLLRRTFFIHFKNNLFLIESLGRKKITFKKDGVLHTGSSFLLQYVIDCVPTRITPPHGSGTFLNHILENHFLFCLHLEMILPGIMKA